MLTLKILFKSIEYRVAVPFLTFIIAIYSISTSFANEPSTSLPTTSAITQSVRLVFIGDSLTDGYGIDKQKSYPSLVEERLIAIGHKNIKVVNASISGSTSASALGRFKWHLKEKPDILILALGANDGLRGLPLKNTEENLTKVIKLAQSEGIEVVLAGMKLPPNYGQKYISDFENLFIRLAKKYKTHFIPFLLEGVGGEPHMNQEDGIHPNERGHQKMADTVYPYILKAVQSIKK